jgi:alkylation response protein AidB-like acyl-CoA dehydrogenase
MTFPKTERQEKFMALADQLAAEFAPRAAKHDRENSFPFENFARLKETGYLALTVPAEYGGGGADPLEFALAQERLARGDSATALASAMHLSLVGRVGEARTWPEAIVAPLFRDIVDNGALINAAHSEPDLGSPSRGGLPSTTAIRTADGWRITGRKSWASLAPALTYASILAAAIEEGQEPRRANFLVPTNSPGFRVVETWDNLGMRATASHDVELTDVEVGPDAILPPDGSSVPGDGRGWSGFGVPAVYLGIAGAARDAAVKFAQERVPNGMPGPIATLPTIQRSIAEMELLLLQAGTVLFGTAEEWVQFPERRESLSWKVAAGKYLVSNHAIRVTDLALRVTGSAGLAKTMPIERHYRDVRTSLNMPPIDDIALTTIGKAALGLT